MFGLIGHTQPRRIAARALANRLAEELQTSVGGAVGYQVRFTDHTGPQCRVKLMTDGILLRELEADRDLRRYDTLIIDEAHERSLNIDLLLGALKTVLTRRHDLKLIVTSATIDTQRFAEFFNGAPIIEVSGRSYPVEVRYRPLFAVEGEAEAAESAELSLPEGVLAAVHEFERESASGDVLVFLPGEKQIREVDKALRDAKLRSTEVLPLYARLSVGEQEKIFKPHTGRRIVLATNVAETSLTVPGIHYVIDSGLARISRYSVRGKVQRLPIEKISQASADQRKGRCGRIAAGVCIRLYDEDDFNTREAFTPPEVLRTNLASVILKLAMLRLPDPTQFAFIDAPELKLINDGYRLLQELKAVDEQKHITALGKQIAALPLDPRLARMLLAADHHRCLREMLVIAAFLSAQDPRERPQDAQQKADQHHASYADVRSDFMTVLTLWQRFHDTAKQLSGNQLRKWCREQFLSFIRLREWQEVHSQLREAVDELGLRPNQVDASYAELHQAILTGFLGGIGQLDEKRDYLGARGTRFVIAPGTPLASKPPKWLVAASLLETTRMYARMVAMVEPQWIEAAGEHLLKRQYSEPHWVAARGFVAALVTASLYGLTLSAQRRINYASVAPEEARQIFVRAALVEGQADIRAAFLKHNRMLLQQVAGIEARIRRRDVLVDEQAQVDFYLQRLPRDIHSATAFQRWLKHHANAAELHMQLSDLVRRDLADYDVEQYPEHLLCAGNQLTLSYQFEPALPDDGVTLTAPQPVLPLLDEAQLHWAIPGWHVERTTELLRALPKSLRKHFVPVPHFAQQALLCLRDGSNSVTNYDARLAQWITQHSGTPFTLEDLHALVIPAHLQIRIKVVDLHGKTLVIGRDLRELQRQTHLTQQNAPPVRAISASTVEKADQPLRQWPGDDVPLQRQIQQQGVRFTVYPALQDQGDRVALVELSSQEQAQRVHQQGVLRLAILALPQQYKYLKQQFAGNRELLLLGQGSTGKQPLAEQLAERVFRECFVADDTDAPRTAAAFAERLERQRDQLNDIANRLAVQMTQMFQDWRALRQTVNKLTAPIFLSANQDLQQQMQALLPQDFLRTTHSAQLTHLPRYIKAALRRAERLAGNATRDAQLQAQVQPYLRNYEQLRARQAPQSIELDKLRWMIEEFRVSLFAQELKTAVPVSAKRLDEQVNLAKKEVG